MCQLGERDSKLTISPVWPGEYLEKFLFRGVGKVLMLSATIRPKLLELLGIDDYKFNEAPSSFPVDRRLVKYIDAPRITYRTPPSEKKYWVAMIDNVLRARRDRNVLIHTHSYARRNEIISMSGFGREMIGHDASNVQRVVEAFKAARGKILVSQSLDEGWDFPYGACETQIISKIPYADSRDAVIKARQGDDKDYSHYTAMQSLVQMAGRAMRAPDDFCENFIIDGNSMWFLPKYRHFAPAWFNESIKRVNTIPEPAPVLGL